MELTSTYFIVGTLLKCLLCSLAAITVYQMMHTLPPIRTPEHTNFEDIGLNHEIIFIIIFGVLCGKIAVLFNHILLKIIFLRVRVKNQFISNRWKWCSTVVLFISIISFPIEYFHINEKNIDNQFFSNVKDMGDVPHGSHGKLYHLLTNPI